MIRVTELRLALALLAVAACSGDVTSPTPPANPTSGASTSSLLPGVLRDLLPVDTTGTALISCPTEATQTVSSTIGPSVGVLAIGNTTVVIPVKFTSRPLNFRMMVNAAGLVGGFFVQPGAVEWQRPAYSKPDSFTEREVTVGDAEWKLPGTLTLPKGSPSSQLRAAS